MAQDATRRWAKRRRLVPIGAILVPALLTGCGTATLDPSQAGHQIELGIQRATGRRVTASCPSRVPVAKGRVTWCRVTAADGSSASVRVVQTDSSGHVRYSSPVLHTAEVEQQISSSASAKLGFAVKVTCPDLVEVTRGTRFHCKATGRRGQSATVTVTALSATGGFHYDIGPSG